MLFIGPLASGPRPLLAIIFLCSLEFLGGGPSLCSPALTKGPAVSCASKLSLHFSLSSQLAAFPLGRHSSDSTRLPVTESINKRPFVSIRFQQCLITVLALAPIGLGYCYCEKTMFQLYSFKHAEHTKTKLNSSNENKRCYTFNKYLIAFRYRVVLGVGS